MNFGKFNKIIIFGGGENANYFASICKEKKIEVISIVHPRHYNQVLENKKKFSSSISKYSKIHKVSTLNIKKLKKIIPNPSNNFYISLKKELLIAIPQDFQKIEVVVDFLGEF